MCSFETDNSFSSLSFIMEYVIIEHMMNKPWIRNILRGDYDATLNSFGLLEKKRFPMKVKNTVSLMYRV
jgi:hypothetical protein